MNQSILTRLAPITPEEQVILNGRRNIDRDLYMLGEENTVNARKLLSAGKLITMRSHTRFVHFPPHSHDYVEVVYMCAGSTTHIVNGSPMKLQAGELLFLNQNTVHEIEAAGEQDLAVNFIVLPVFFGSILSYLGEEETPLRRFLVNCLCQENRGASYLHFRVADVTPVQNLIENLLYILMDDTPNRRKMSQLTMALLFMQLMGHTEMLATPDEEQSMVLRVLSYVESRYTDGSLTELAKLLHYDLYNLSREIKRRTGRTYTQLVQERRLSQAAFLLKTTNRNVDEVAAAVGYENMGYFYRIFRDAYQMSPREYRLQIR